MLAALFAASAMALYLAAAVIQGRQLAGLPTPARRVFLGIGWLGLLLHALSAASMIVSDMGVNLGLFAAASLIAAVFVAVVLISCWQRPLENLLIVTYPVAIVAIACSLLLDTGYRPRADLGAGAITHIFLSVLAYGVLTIAMFQSLWVWLQEYLLRHKHMTVLLGSVPPLATMESLMFQLLLLGAILLAMSILAGAWVLNDLFAQHVVHHTVLSLTSLATFCVLLWGHHRRNWRGRHATGWMLAGFAQLMLAYFGTKLVMEVILDRV